MSMNTGRQRNPLAERLIHWRKVEGLSQRALSKASKISQATIRDIETGAHPHPRPETLRRLALGLVRDANDGDFDVEGADGAFADLMRAAGYTNASGLAADAEAFDDQVAFTSGTSGDNYGVATELERAARDRLPWHVVVLLMPIVRLAREESEAGGIDRPAASPELSSETERRISEHAVVAARAYAAWSMQRRTDGDDLETLLSALEGEVRRRVIDELRVLAADRQAHLDDLHRSIARLERSQRVRDSDPNVDAG